MIQVWAGVFGSNDTATDDAIKTLFYGARSTSEKWTYIDADITASTTMIQCSRRSQE